MRWLKLIIPLLLIHVISLGQKGKPAMDQLTLFSPAFSEGATIPKKFTCEGSDTSPPLEWNQAPHETQSIAVSCIDPDAPMGDWIHWIVWNIPPEWKGLEEGVDPNAQFPFTQGRNSWGVTGYGGPCPPKGHGAHRYFFKVYFLDVPKLELSPKATWKDLERAMNGHILAEGKTMGRNERK
jgi:Raf kinase inhibitor-like YbhB/YbcL family protein